MKNISSYLHQVPTHRGGREIRLDSMQDQRDGNNLRRPVLIDAKSTRSGVR